MEKSIKLRVHPLVLTVSIIAASKSKIRTIALRFEGFSDDDLRFVGAFGIYNAVADLLVARDYLRLRQSLAGSTAISSWRL